ncbi:hypothetical protein Pfo_027689 [Paulownia fortunei]|nr:hypothetical protein Pfo_027689 [Paulownia fortunei]
MKLSSLGKVDSSSFYYPTNMSGKQILGNYDIDSSTSPSYLNKDVKNLLHCDHDHADYNLPSDTMHLKEGAVQNFSKFSCAPPSNNFPHTTKLLEVCAAWDFPERCGSLPLSNFPYALKRPKMYATRDFPECCGALASQINEKGTNVMAAEHSNAGNCVADIPTKTFRNMNTEPVNSLASCSRNDVMEHKINAHHSNEVASPSMTWTEEQEKVATTFVRLKQSEHHAFVKSVDGGNDAVVGSNDEPNYNLNGSEVANMSAVPHDVALVDKNKVNKTLKLFRELYKELLGEYKVERKGEGTGARRFDLEAADRLKKKGKWIHSVKHFGHIPGIAIGDQFHFRVELAVVGLHCQYVSGIDYVVRDGKKLATSIVNSGRYENKAKTVDVLIYSGQGGHAGWGNKADQKLRRGNLALVNSNEVGNPVRVIQKSKNLKAYNTSVMNDNRGFAYTYDGLYVVNRFWQERDSNGKLVFKFELHRMSGQQKLSHQNAGESRKSTREECCVVDDVSQGKENMPIRAMNGIDGEKPQTFAYITSTIYPEWCKQIQHSGCNCTNGCSNSGQCICVLKNGGEIPFSEKSALLRQKAIVYECGSSCKCPPSCMNKVSQHGPRYRLELYKTESRGWGVRSRSYISSGSFICEYIGKVQPIRGAKQRVDHDPGRFSSCLNSESRNHDASSAVSSPNSRSDKNETGFIIDASKLGNVGRFISYSSSPSLLVQRILYDNDDERMPHIMLFAAKNIRPLQELTCDYNHQMMDRICQFQYRLQQ